MFHPIKRLKKRKTTLPQTKPMPEWNEIVKIMFDRQLDSFQDTVVEVMYSKDRSMRYVITQDEQGLFWYCLEALYQFDDDEWAYICSDQDALPAMWETHPDAHYHSVFDSREHVWNEIRSEPFYKAYFL